MLCTENKPEADLDSYIIYDENICGNVMSGRSPHIEKTAPTKMMLKSYTCLSLLLSSVSMTKLEVLSRAKTQRTQRKHFTYWHLLSFLGAKNIVYCFLCWETFVLWLIHLYTRVSTKFYSNQYPYSENIWINCKGFQSPEVCYFETGNLFSHRLILKKLCFQPPN